MDSCNTLLDEEFEGESHYDKYTHSISINRHHVVSNEITVSIRKKAIELLILSFNAKRNDQKSIECLNQIISILRFMAMSQTNDSQLIKKDEVDIVVQFLENLLDNNPSISERSCIIKELRINESIGLKNEYLELTGRLMDLAENVKKNKEKLELVLQGEYFSIRENIEIVLKNIIEDYFDWESFYCDLVRLDQRCP